MATPKKVTVEVHKFKEHTKVVRYKEAEEDNPVIGSLYVSKSALEKMGNPPTLQVTIEP